MTITATRLAGRSPRFRQEDLNRGDQSHPWRQAPVTSATYRTLFTEGRTDLTPKSYRRSTEV